VALIRDRPTKGTSMAAAGADPQAGAAVLAVVADLRYWSDHGVRIVAVEPDDGDGVRVGVSDHPATAEQALCGHYSFPVACWAS
jgi:hypothetical protein